jgi:hypothetical protein
MLRADIALLVRDKSVIELIEFFAVSFVAALSISASFSVNSNCEERLLILLLLSLSSIMVEEA